MDIINFDDFLKLNIRVGKIISAEEVEGSNKLLKMKVDTVSYTHLTLPTTPYV